MPSRTRTPFQSVTSEGAILPMDLLQRVAADDADLGGLRPQDYGLGKTEKISEAASRSWNRLQALWKSFRDDRLRLDDRPDARGTTETREGWLLPLFEELGYGRLRTATYTIEGKTYPVSHGYGALPVHLLSYKVDLDRRTPGVAGAATYAPHAMVQELLNRSDDHLWAVLTNGLKLRLLRDNATLTRMAYVEFDLEAMFEGEAYADFLLLWQTAHASRTEGDPPETCWLEQWSQQAHDQGTRALDDLRDGVERAISELGAGFIAHPANEALREALRSGALDAQDYYRQLLRLAYRLIFLFTAEDRGALLDPDADDDAQKRYTDYYSTAALRALAEKRRGSPRHHDRWEQLKLIMRALGETGEPRLALPALGSFLWSDDAIGTLAGSTLANEPFLEAVRALSLVEQGGIRRSVDYKHLGPEELGGIYEGLLELQPRLDLDARTFALEAVAGSERKTTGSYYTPEGLIQALLDTALDPVLDHAEKADDPEAALLALKVCDPAVGSGHFLIAAAHRIAGRLARVRSDRADGGEPTRPQRQHALRDVIARCVYGVDLNPMALELCKVNLWLEALEPGKPLSFLDHHLQVGNGLLGATPAALVDGIPDDVFPTKANLLTGDDYEVAAEYRKRNRDFRKTRQTDLFSVPLAAHLQPDSLREGVERVNAGSESTVEAVQRKAAHYAEIVGSDDYQDAKLLADAWCAAFIWPKRTSERLPHPIHEEVYRQIEADPAAAPDWMRAEVLSLAERYRFFHWHLAFPDAFRVPTSGEAATDETAGWTGGFDCVLGNPPWDVIETDDEMSAEEASDVHAVQHLISNSGIYPYSGNGKKNLYALFAERAVQTMAPIGKAGHVLPTGLFTDKPTESVGRWLTTTPYVERVLDFQNKRSDGSKHFVDVHPQYRFSLVTLSGAKWRASEPAFAFDLDAPSEASAEGRLWTMSPADIEAMSPARFAIPMLKNSDDAAIVAKAYRSGTPLHQLRKQGLKVSSSLLLNFGTLAKAIKRTISDATSPEAFDRLWQVYEGSYFHAYDHRFAAYNGSQTEHVGQNKKVNPVWTPRMETAVDPADGAAAWIAKSKLEVLNWYVGLRRQARATDAYTSIASILPPSVAEGSASVFFGAGLNGDRGAWLVANLNSFMFNYLGGIRLSGANFNKSVYEQVPLVRPRELDQECPWAPGETLADWLRPRVLELTYTAWDLQPFARDVGYDGPPFVWDPGRREALRAELDAAFFHLYLGTEAEWVQEPRALRDAFATPRDAVGYVMDTFPIVRRKDEKAHGSYRTKDRILTVYDRLGGAAAGGTAYETRLDPPPASPEAAHPAREAQA